MKINRILTVLAFVSLVVCPSFVGAQSYDPDFSKSFPKDYFRHPLDVPIAIKGTFAEIRPNHFHGGVDFGVGGKVGEPIHAAADGYISRISISPWGGGKILYVTHPNGFRTVYMHCNDFVGAIAAFAKNYQYAQQSYAIDVTLPVDSIPVKKGQVIAHAGNTGGSMGPHLHLEFRYAENDQNINPLYFGTPYSDPVAPTVRNIKVYPADEQTLVNGGHSPLRMFDRQTVKGKTSSVTRDTFRVQGRFYVGIYTTDVSETGSTSKNGVEKVELYVDDTLYHIYSVPTILPGETRGINAVIDYPEFQKSGEYYVITRFLPGDHTNVSIPMCNMGYISFGDRRLHKLEYRVSDYKGNTTKKRFYVRDLGPAKQSSTDTSVDVKGEPIDYQLAKRIVRPGFEAQLKANTLYDNDIIAYQTFARANFLGPCHSLELVKNQLPPHSPIVVRLAVPEVDSSQLDHLVIVCINGKKENALTTTREGDILRAQSSNFGTFGVRLDTQAPSVNPQNISEGGTCPSVINIKMTDNLAGIATYNCYLNGKWVLAEYDGKNNLISIDTRGAARTGTNKFRVVITDNAHNTYDRTFNLKK